MKSIRFFFSLLHTSIRASISLRGAFIFESILMIVNNLIFLVMWWIFFRQFKDVAGWTMRDLIALNAIGLGSLGLMKVCFGGTRNLGKIILNGDLDLFMIQPKNPILHLAGSQSQSKGWGHLMTSVVLVFLGNLLPFLPLILISILSGGLIFTSISIIAHSMVFWLGPVEAVSKKYVDSLYLFVIYPPNVYSGILQIIMFTLLPAGIIGFLPVTLIQHFSWPGLLILLLSSATFLALAFTIFHLGLKRYESGNQFGMRL